jgi:hypothetical protein
VVFLTWSDFEVDPTKEQHLNLCKSRKSATETLQDSISRARIPIPKEAKQVKGKFKSMLIIFFDIKRIVHKEFVLAGQKLISHTPVTFHEDCVKMFEDFTTNFSNIRIGCCTMTKHCPLSPENFWPKTTWLPSSPTLLFSVSPIGNKTGRSPFLHNWSDRNRIAGGAEHPHRTRLLGCN